MKNVRLLASIAAGAVLLSATALARRPTKKAERAWKAKCASCHGQTGKGDTDKGKELKVEDMTAAKYQGKKDDELKKAVLDGVKSGRQGSHAVVQGRGDAGAGRRPHQVHPQLQEVAENRVQRAPGQSRPGCRPEHRVSPRALVLARSSPGAGRAGGI